LRLGAARTGLNIHKAVGGVRGVGKHPPELEALNASTDLIDIAFDGNQGLVVVLCGAHIEKFVRLTGSRVELLQTQNDVLEGLPFATEFLRTFGIIPDPRIFK